MATYVLYHAGCWDGFCAAWIARKVLTESPVFLPVHYGMPLPDLEPHSDVYILDFSYPCAVMRELIERMNFVCVLDHHETAEKELAGLFTDGLMFRELAHRPEIRFDMNKSGGRLAWEYFCTDPKSSLANCPVPWLVDYTEDRDLWRHTLPWSREINAWLRSWQLDFVLWDEFAMTCPGCERWDMRIDEGSAILRREKQIVSDHIRHAREIELGGHKILAVNATVLFSDIAGELAKGRPFGACYFDRRDGKTVFSLRSAKDGENVAEIAKKYGGGGHRHAAGFESYHSIVFIGA